MMQSFRPVWRETTIRKQGGRLLRVSSCSAAFLPPMRCSRRGSGAPRRLAGPSVALHHGPASIKATIRTPPSHHRRHRTRGMRDIDVCIAQHHSANLHGSSGLLGQPAQGRRTDCERCGFAAEGHTREPISSRHAMAALCSAILGARPVPCASPWMMASCR